jgi:LmbE family N-acetylglucosaminyl deacetylase
MRHDPSAPGVVLSPHPDDAVLSAWCRLCGPGDVVVVNVCAGIPPAGASGWFDPVLGVSDAAELMRLRLAEDAAALMLAGTTPVNLPFLDAQYADEALSPEALCNALELVVTHASWLCAPAGIGGHADHVGVRDVAIELARDSSIPLSLYAELPYAVSSGWPHWVTGRQPRPYLVPEARWQKYLATIPLPPDDLHPRPHALGDDAARKLEALETYRTQFETLNAGPLDRLRHPEVLGFELHWDVRPVGGSAT